MTARIRDVGTVIAGNDENNPNVPAYEYMLGLLAWPTKAISHAGRESTTYQVYDIILIRNVRTTDCEKSEGEGHFLGTQLFYGVS